MKYIYLLFLLISFLLFAKGIEIFIGHFLFFRNAILVSGTVVRCDKEESYNREKRTYQTFYKPIIEYVYNGQTYTLDSSVSYTEPEPVGKTYTVGIKPHKNNEARVYNLKETMLFVGAFLLGGIIFLIMGFFFSPYANKLLELAADPQAVEKIQEISYSRPQTSADLLTMAKLLKFCITTLFFIIPMLLCGFGIYLWYSRTEFFRNAVMISGTVVRYDEQKQYDEENRRYQTMYTEVVSYSIDGQTREITGNFSSNSYNPDNIGKTRPVGIHPQNHNDARIYSKGEFIIAYALMGAGLIWLLIMLKAVL